jgi:diadenylate cyclase
LEIYWALSNLDLRAIIDILLVALMFFGLSFFIRGTQAMALLRGVLLLLGIVVIVSNVLQLTALRWLLQNVLTFLAVAIPVIFQPELRRALERLGRAGFLVNRQAPENLRTKIIDDICQATERLSERRHGALIVLQRNSGLQEYIRTGVSLNAEVSPQLLLTVFWPKTELHDGAAILDNRGRVAAAACVLPLSSARTMTTPKLGTRHRAALGMSEVSDAICVVVSEETGRISIANGGRLIPRLDTKRLRTILNAFYGPERAENLPVWQRLRDAVDMVVTRVREQRKQA